MSDKKRIQEAIKVINEFFRENKELSPEQKIPLEVLDDRVAELYKQIVYVQRPPKTPPERLQYLREWRKEQREIENLKKKKDKQERKIEKALRRAKLYCYACKKTQEINPETNTYRIIQKTNDKFKRIQIQNKCPDCEQTLRAFGGYLPDIFQ